MADMIDVSSVQHPHNVAIDWKAVASSGVKAVMVKATEGATYVNPWLVRDAEGAEAAGLWVGFYHFAHPSLSAPQAQIDAFIRAIGPLAHQIGLALDIEEQEGLSWPELASWSHTFLTALRTHTSWPILYSDRSWLEEMPGAPFGGRLWLASPGVHPTTRPYAWQMGTATVPGIARLVDVGQLYDMPVIH